MERDEYERKIQNENGEKRGVVSIASLLPKLEKSAKKKGGVNSAFNNAVSFVVQFMGEEKEPERFGYWCGRLRRFDSSAIFAMISKSKGGNRPRALFEYILKAEIVKVKKLSTASMDRKG